MPGLVLVAGGKYTTYRVMAEDAVDAAVAGLPGGAGLAARPTCRWSARTSGQVSATPRRSSPPASGLPEAPIERLLHRHGDRIGDVLDLARPRPGARAAR